MTRSAKALTAAFLVLAAAALIALACGSYRGELLQLRRFQASAKELQLRLGGASADPGSNSLKELERQEEDLEKSNKLEQEIHRLLQSNANLKSTTHNAHEAAHLATKVLEVPSARKRKQVEDEIDHLLRANAKLAEKNEHLAPRRHTDTAQQHHALHRNMMSSQRSPPPPPPNAPRPSVKGGGACPPWFTTSELSAAGCPVLETAHRSWVQHQVAEQNSDDNILRNLQTHTSRQAVIADSINALLTIEPSDSGPGEARATPRSGAGRGEGRDRGGKGGGLGARGTRAGKAPKGLDKPAWMRGLIKPADLAPGPWETSWRAVKDGLKSTTPALPWEIFSANGHANGH